MDADDLPEIDEYAEAVLSVVETIPHGRVMSYGQVAATVGVELGVGGPRQVARVMRRLGATVPWWRVLRADGTPAPEVAVRQIENLTAEGVLLRHGRVPRAVFVDHDTSRRPSAPGPGSASAAGE